MRSRREFLKSTSIVSFSPLLPRVFEATARAAEAQSDDRVLVVIQLDGGNDGINTVVPFGDDGYGRVRNKLRLDTKSLHKLDDHVGLHPEMRAAKQLYDDGRMAIVQGVGYPNPNRSHFRSMKIWQTASVDEAAQNGYGWVGSALDARVRAADATRNAEPNAIFVGEQETPLALWGRRSSSMAITRAQDLKLNPHAAFASSLFSSTNNPTDRQSLQQFVTKQVASAYAAAEEFQKQQNGRELATDISYPGSKLASRLQLISKLLKSGSSARVYYAIQNGYDTHSTQLFTHARLLREFSESVKVFLDDLKSSGLEDRVLVLAFSEFGRRVQENDSKGTDHGTAGPVFLAGSSVTPGLLGATPDLCDLDHGDLKMNVDFRSVYSTVLDDWLCVDSAQVLGSVFESLPLVET